MRSQTDSQNGPASGQPSPYDVEFGAEEGIILGVVNPDGATEDGEEIAGLNLRQRKARGGYIDRLDLEPAFCKPRSKRAQIFEGKVAKDDSP